MTTSKDKIKALIVEFGSSGKEIIKKMFSLGIDDAQCAILHKDNEGLSFSTETHKISCDRVSFKENESIHQVMAGFEIVFLLVDMDKELEINNVLISAQIAKKSGALTLGIMHRQGALAETLPQTAEKINLLTTYVDTLITIPNQPMDSSATESLSYRELSHPVLYQATKAILNAQKSLKVLSIGLEDICLLMKDGGFGLFGSGYAVGEDALTHAVKKALLSPLLDTTPLARVKSMLITITVPSSTNFFKIKNAVDKITGELHANAEVIFGVVIDDNTKGVHIAITASKIDS